MSPRQQPGLVPPARWCRSKGGHYFELCPRGRNGDGRRLYRLRGLPYGALGKKRWTIEELEADGVLWLKTKPSRARIRAAEARGAS